MMRRLDLAVLIGGMGLAIYGAAVILSRDDEASQVLRTAAGANFRP